MSRRILIVDDDGAAKELDSALERAGLETLRVFAPRHLEQAMAHDRAGAVMVPGLRTDVADWVARIRALEGGKDLPVLVYGFGAAQDTVANPSDALEAGADYFFKLPTDMDYLAGRVAAWTESPPSLPPPSEVPTGSFTLEALDKDRRPGSDGLPLLGALRGESPGDESWSWVQATTESSVIPDLDTAVDEGPPIPEARIHPERTDPNLQAPPISEGSTHDAIVVPDSFEAPLREKPEASSDSSGRALIRDADLALAEDRRDDALEALETAAALFRADDDPGAAKTALDRALSLTPTRVDLAQTCADLALETGQLEEACRVLERCAEAWGPAVESLPLWERLSQLRPEVPRYAMAVDALREDEDEDETITPPPEHLDQDGEPRLASTEPRPAPFAVHELLRAGPTESEGAAADAPEPAPAEPADPTGASPAAPGPDAVPAAPVPFDADPSGLGPLDQAQAPSEAPVGYDALATAGLQLPPDPMASGALQSGPASSGPLQSGPIASGPLQSGPVASGPLESGSTSHGAVLPKASEAALFEDLSPGSDAPAGSQPMSFETSGIDVFDEEALAALAPEPQAPPREAVGPGAETERSFDPRAFAAFLEGEVEAEDRTPVPEAETLENESAQVRPSQPGTEAEALDDPALNEPEPESTAWRDTFRAALEGRAELPVPSSRPPAPRRPSLRPGFKAWLEASQIPSVTTAEPAVAGASAGRSRGPVPILSRPPESVDAWGSEAPPAPKADAAPADSWATRRPQGSEAGELLDSVAAVQLMHRLHEVRATGLLSWNGERLVWVDGEPRGIRGHRALEDLEERFGASASQIPLDGPLRPRLLGLARVLQMGPSALDLALSRALEEALGRFVAYRGPWRFEPQNTARDEWLPPLPLRERLADAVADHVPFDMVWAEVAGPLTVDPRRPIPRRERERRLLALLGTHSLDDARRLAGLTKERAGALALVWLGQGLAQKSPGAPASGAALDEEAPSAPVPHDDLVGLSGPERLQKLLQLARTSDYFRLLDVSASASPAEVDRAHAFVKSLLPEAWGGPEDSRREELVEILDEARAVLRDPRLRDAYKAHILPP
ncbi:MAG: hypothetical protein AAGJ19_09910 [Myxococcota bacterium]